MRGDLFFWKICAFALYVGASVPVNAATIQVQMQALASRDDNDIYNPTTVADTTVSGAPTNAAVTGGPVSPILSGTTYDGTSFGSASADIVTGELKAKAEVVYTTTTLGPQRDDNRALGQAIISETFNVIGNGTVTAYMDLHGSYHLSDPFYDAVNFQILAHLDFSGAVSGTNDYFSRSSGASDPTSDTVNQMLTSIANVQNGSIITLTASLLAQLEVGEGLIDFGNTATLFLMTSEGLTLTPSDSRFLSNPAFTPAAVPLPASLPFFGAGLAGLGLLGWRRKRKTAAV